MIWHKRMVQYVELEALNAFYNYKDTILFPNMLQLVNNCFIDFVLYNYEEGIIFRQRLFQVKQILDNFLNICRFDLLPKVVMNIHFNFPLGC